MLPAAAREALTMHLADVRRLHKRDLARGFGHVVLPFALRVGREESDGSAVSGYARASHVFSGAPIAMPAWKATPMNGFVALVLLSQSWIRASVGAYPSRSAIWREVCAIPSRVSKPGGGPDSCWTRLRFPGITTVDDGVTSPRDTRGFAAH